jgi:uroporphyrinogen-III synthase
MPVVVWTRSADDWKHDKPLLKTRHLEPLHLPCISMTGMAVKFPKRKPHMFIVTSNNAVQYTARHKALFNLMRSCEGVFTIGEATRTALKAFKIDAEVPPGVTNAEQLASWLSKNIRPGTDVAWPCSREPSFDFTTELARYDIHIDPLPVYATDKNLYLPHGKLPDADDVKRFIATLDGVVCFASPSAIDGFTRTLNPSENRLRGGLTACCIGTTTAAFAEGHFDRIVVAKEHSVESLAELAAKEVAILQANR